MSKTLSTTEYHFVLEPKITIDFGGSALLVLRLGFAVRVLKRPFDLGVKPKAEEGRMGREYPWFEEYGTLWSIQGSIIVCLCFYFLLHVYRHATDAEDSSRANMLLQ
jgi:hypothetical protein